METTTETQILRESTSDDKENCKSDEPPKKKTRFSDREDLKNKLEDRLCGILQCPVCLDLPKTCYQVSSNEMRGGWGSITFG